MDAPGTFRPRVAVNPFLNAAPLTRFLPYFYPHAVYEDVFPGDMQAKLLSGEMDLGLTAVYDLLNLPDATILGDACIACDGPALSVLMMSRIPFTRIATLAVDEKSHSSSALAELILRAEFQRQPTITHLPLDAELSSRREDALLLIGDRALELLASGNTWEFVVDLGDFWKKWTGLPFVFAAWIGSESIDWKSNGMIEAIQRGRDYGISQVEDIIRTHSSFGKIPLSMARDYLGKRLIYSLGKEERRGMNLFFELMAKYGMISPMGGMQ
jgi:chorismate dehydratase